MASFDELTLAPLPTKTGHVIDYGGGGVGFHQLKWLPTGQITSSPGRGQRMKRKRDEKDGRVMQCYYARCPVPGGHRFIYCPNDGFWKDDGVLEANTGGVPCPKGAEGGASSCRGRPDDPRSKKT